MDASEVVIRRHILEVHC